MRRRTLIVATIAALGLLAAAASSYPPRGCGRETVRGNTVAVQTHGPTCGFARDWSRTWISSHRAPKGFACRTYAGDEPAFCKHRTRRNYYFLATRP